MAKTKNSSRSARSSAISRRHFISTGGTAAVAFTALSPEFVKGADASEKIQVGLVGCGGRGIWIAKLFNNHGGYQIAGVADYFKDKVETAGKELAVPESKQFTGLSGYRRLLEQKIDVLLIQSPPYFHPEQAAEGVAAGKHVYLAKPIAVDVPGCQSIEASGRLATGKNLCFLVDFQTRAHPDYQEVVRRVHKGQIGRLVSAEATYMCDLYFKAVDEVFRKSSRDAEARLRAWTIDRVLSGDVITEQNIHCLDVASWFLKNPPIEAEGTGGQARGFEGDCWDHFSVRFRYPNDVTLTFSSKQFGFGYNDIMCRVYGTEGTADTHYAGKVWVRSRDDGFNGNTANLYQDGAVRNIAAFHQAITRGDYSNPTVSPSVESNLTTILGRTAAYQRGKVTWKEMMVANEAWEFDLSGVKA